MPRQVAFVQGGGEGTHDEWDNKLVDSLGRALGAGYEIHYPRMPDEADPIYPRWAPAIIQAIDALGENAVVVGHSLGAMMLINVLAERKTRHRPAAVFLVAPPFVGNGGWPGDDIAPMDDLGSRLPKDLRIYIYQGDADDTAPFAHLGLYAKAVHQAVVRPLKGRDHQLNNDLTEVAHDLATLG